MTDNTTRLHSAFSKPHAGFAPRLSQAGLSLSFVLFASFVIIIVSDLSKAPVWFDRSYSGFLDIGYYQTPTRDAFLGAGLFAVPLGIWHLCDLASNGNSKSKSGWLTASYPWILVCLLLGLVGMAILQSGITAWLSCLRFETPVATESGNRFGFYCTPKPAYMAEFLVLPFLYMLVFLALAKSQSVIRARLI